MIAHLSGRLQDVAGDHVIVDVGGVGYLVYCSAQTLARLGPRGDAVSLHIDTHVREDHIHLYGFADRRERDWYRLLLGVQGVGARMAIGVLSTLGPEELTGAIVAQDKAVLTRASGVGPKLAGRLISELKDKVVGQDWPAMPVAGVLATPAPAGASAEAVSALINLGYGRAEAMRAVSGAAQAGSDDTAALIRAGLKELAS